MLWNSFFSDGFETLRRSRVSAAIRPLLGSPRRISFLSEIVPSALPFTTATWGCDKQHRNDAARFTVIRIDGDDEKTGSDGVGDEGCFGNVGTTDMAMVASKSDRCCATTTTYSEIQKRRQRHTHTNVTQKRRRTASCDSGDWK